MSNFSQNLFVEIFRSFLLFVFFFFNFSVFELLMNFNSFIFLSVFFRYFVTNALTKRNWRCCPTELRPLTLTLAVAVAAAAAALPLATRRFACGARLMSEI